MKNSRERNILIVVLGVAGLGLLIDRVIIGSDVTGPAESSAGVIDAFDPSLADPATFAITQTDEPVALSAPVVSLTQRLREAVGDSAEAAEPDQTRDAFTPGPGWQTAVLSDDGTTDNHSRRLAQDFLASHSLEAVMVLGDSRFAVIGGQTLSIGQEVDGYKLVAVRERSAVFERSGVNVEIGITTAPASP